MKTAAKPVIKPTTIRLEDSLKTEASRLCESMGMSYNTYVVMATRQLVNQRRIPFEIVAGDYIPNEETRRAMIAAEAKALGLIPDDSPIFNNPDDLMTYLEAD